MFSLKTDNALLYIYLQVNNYCSKILALILAIIL